MTPEHRERVSGGRARTIKDPMVLHLRRRLKSIGADVEAYVVDRNDDLSKKQGLSMELRDRRDKLDATVRQLMDQLKEHARYVEDPNDPAIRTCDGLYANAKGYLKRLRTAPPAARRVSASRGPDPLRERYRGVRTVSGGLPGLGKRR